MKRVKIIIHILIIGLLFGLIIGCGGGDSDEEAQPDANQNETTEQEGEVVTIDENSTEQEDDYDYSPVLKNGSEKFKIAVCISGEHPNYADVLGGHIYGLAKLGWMKDIEINQENVLKAIEDIIGTSDYSDYLDFSTDRYFSMQWKNMEDYEAASEEEKKKITEVYDAFDEFLKTKDIDLIISLGTTVTYTLSRKDDVTIPVYGDSITDPVAAGIVASNEDSGKDNLSVKCDPNRYIRQVRLFHNVIGFEKLGIVYPNSESGKAQAALASIEQVAEERGFEVVGNYKGVPEEVTGENIDSYLNAIGEILPKVDAFFLSGGGGRTYHIVPKVIEVINHSGNPVPTFAMDGSKFVKHGILMSISSGDSLAYGLFAAKNMVKILKGAKPRDLNQIFEHEPKIAINLEEAERINYDVPVNYLASSDEVYEEIHPIEE